MMFKNNISKEFCQEIDKKDAIIHQKVRASEEKKREKNAYFWHSANSRAKKLLKNRRPPLPSGKI